MTSSKLLVPCTPDLLLTMIPPLLILLSVTICVATAAEKAPDNQCLKKQYQLINGHRMAYVDIGKGDPIVFLHGNPTSSYLWRNVMPHLEGQGRLIAPDLIGMGDSDKLPTSNPSRYSFFEHVNYLFTLLETIGVKERITFVVHDWGSALGFWWAYLNRHNTNAVKGIAFMEAMVTSFNSSTEYSLDADLIFALRGPDGEKLILQDNIFLKVLLPGAIIRNLTDEEFAEYNRPFLNKGEDRRPMLTWARELPIDGVPMQVTNAFDLYSEWLAKSAELPKLFVKAVPGFALSGAFSSYVRTWPNLEEVSVPGRHYLQEDSPDLIGSAISNWLRRLS